MTLTVASVVVREPLTLRIARPSLVVTLEASTVEAIVGRERNVVDRTSCLVAPRGSLLSARSRTPANRIAVLGFGDELVAGMVRRYAKLGVERDRLARWMRRVELLSRTVWVHEIVHRYVFERDALGEHGSLAARFLEIEILKEIYFLFRDREAGADRASVAQKNSPCVERAVAWIDAHLFEPCSVAELARRAGASESTLLRAFRRELGSKPSEYWRTRRLDEALVWLRAGRYSVAEASTRAGYESATAFTHAFRRRFGKAPSTFLPSRPTKRAP